MEVHEAEDGDNLEHGSRIAGDDTYSKGIGMVETIFQLHIIRSQTRLEDLCGQSASNSDFDKLNTTVFYEAPTYRYYEKLALSGSTGETATN